MAISQANQSNITSSSSGLIDPTTPTLASTSRLAITSTVPPILTISEPSNKTPTPMPSETLMPASTSTATNPPPATLEPQNTPDWNATVAIATRSTIAPSESPLPEAESKTLTSALLNENDIVIRQVVYTPPKTFEIVFEYQTHYQDVASYRVLVSSFIIGFSDSNCEVFVSEISGRHDPIKYRNLVLNGDSGTVSYVQLTQESLISPSINYVSVSISLGVYVEEGGTLLAGAFDQPYQELCIRFHG